MARVDLLRWAVTGGKPDGCAGTIQKCDPGASYPDAQLACDATGCNLATNDGIKVKAPWNRITGDEGGLLYQLKNLPVQPRMGSMYFDTNGVNQTVLIGDFTGSASIDGVNPYKNTIAALNSQAPGGSTPIGPALWAAYAYFSQSASVFGSPQPDTSAHGNPYKNPMYQCFDANNDGNCQGNEFALVPCAKNFMILLTDGQWNTPSCNIDTGYESTSSDPVVPAYWLHKKGFTNQATAPQISSNVESLYTVGLWLGGTGAQSLKNVAMYGGFDTSKSWPSDRTGYPLSTCAVDDCGSGKGSPCTALPPSSADWDKDSNGIPDTFFGASDASEIKEKIMTIIFEIMRKASSGTAVSVLSSSEGSGANLMQALFYPKRSFANNTDVSWTSDLMNYWYYIDPFFKSSEIREDTIREGATALPPQYTLLDLKKDYITGFGFDSGQNKTLAHRWFDTTGTGTVLTDLGTVPIESTIPIWRAGFNLWWTAPTARNIYTSVSCVDINSAPCTCGTTNCAPNLIPFNTANYATLDDYFGQTASAVDAKKTINYVRGEDCVDATGVACTCGTSGCTKIGRDRTVSAKVCSSRRSPCNSATDCPSGETCLEETHVWKLGDIISSTPHIMGPGALNHYNSPAPFGYNDQTYNDFIKSNDYKNRQLVFVGANDGMLHAFKLGKLLQNWTGKQWYEAAKLEGDTGVGGIGTESYAFIPKGALPYLQYLYDEDYCHIYMVDGPTTITDAAINQHSTCTVDYWNCPKLTTIKSAPYSGDADFANTSWRAILIGSMGIGGATCDGAAPDVDRISTPLSISGTPVGWSSYFALDVTDQTTPKLLWEFSNADLGVTNVGPAIVRVDRKRCAINLSECTTDSDCGDTTVNGKCVKAKRCAISTGECITDSDCGDTTVNGKCIEANGRWFAILASGSTGPITNKEFKGTSDKKLKIFILDLKTGALLRTIDTGIANAFAGSLSNSPTDLEKDLPSNGGNYQDDAVYLGYVKSDGAATPTWTKGGVLRLAINDDFNLANWTVSKVIDNIGPVTTSVTNLLDRENKKLWLYFAEGRFFYKMDDLTTQRKLFGIQEPCFDGDNNSISPNCTSTVALTDLKDQTTSPSALTPAQKGWYINLDPAASPMSAERVISNPSPDSSGAVFFLPFAPTSDICSFGGTTSFWAVDYATGGQVTFELKGKILVQVSTGEIKEIDLSQALTEHEGRATAKFMGIPPTNEGFAGQRPQPPIKKFMHVQEQ
jgi:type IV pilus assembly protein PilY1